MCVTISGMRTGIYVRISQDRDGDALGVERQRQDCARLAEQRGWQVHDVYIDNDVSAYSGVTRPEYERLLTAIETGAIQAVVAYRSDRLYRRMRDLEHLVNIVERYNVRIATVASGDIDLSTADGRMLARIIGSTAQAESERSGERIRRQRLQAAQEGKTQGGGRRPFGWVGDELHPEESALLRQAIDSLLSGASLGGIVAQWNELGIVTTAGKRWRVGTFRRMVLSERLAGIRYHAPSGTRTRGTWTPIVTEDERAVLLARFPGMPEDAPRQSRRRALLSGVVYCDECGRKLLFTAGRYVCDKRRGAGCGQVRVNDGRALELHVLREAERMSEAARTTERDQEREQQRDALLADLRSLDDRAHSLAVLLGDGTLSPAEFTAARAQVQTQRADLEHRLADGVAPDADHAEAVNDALSTYLSGGALTPAEVALLQDPLRTVVGRVYVAARPARTPFDSSAVRFQLR